MAVATLALVAALTPDNVGYFAFFRSTVSRWRREGVPVPHASPGLAVRRVERTKWLVDGRQYDAALHAPDDESDVALVEFRDVTPGQPPAVRALAQR